MKLQEAQGNFIDKTLKTDYDDDGQFLEIHDNFFFGLFLSEQLYDWWVTVNFILVTLRMTQLNHGSGFSHQHSVHNKL